MQIAGSVRDGRQQHFEATQVSQLRRSIPKAPPTTADKLRVFPRDSVRIDFSTCVSILVSFPLDLDSREGSLQASMQIRVGRAALHSTQPLTVTQVYASRDSKSAPQDRRVQVLVIVENTISTSCSITREDGCKPRAAMLSPQALWITSALNTTIYVVVPVRLTLPCLILHSRISDSWVLQRCWMLISTTSTINENKFVYFAKTVVVMIHDHSAYRGNKVVTHQQALIHSNHVIIGLFGIGVQWHSDVAKIVTTTMFTLRIHSKEHWPNIDHNSQWPVAVSSAASHYIHTHRQSPGFVSFGSFKWQPRTQTYLSGVSKVEADNSGSAQRSLGCITPQFHAVFDDRLGRMEWLGLRFILHIGCYESVKTVARPEETPPPSSVDRQELQLAVSSASKLPRQGRHVPPHIDRALKKIVQFRTAQVQPPPSQVFVPVPPPWPDPVIYAPPLQAPIPASPPWPLPLTGFQLGGPPSAPTREHPPLTTREPASAPPRCSMRRQNA